MKVTYHIPTEQYGFVEIQTEGVLDDEGIASYEEIKNELLSIKGEGLEEKDFRVALDRYLTQGDMDAEAYASMNERQKGVIQEIKKANKRIKSRQ